jgi:hypothetical protein
MAGIIVYFHHANAIPSVCTYVCVCACACDTCRLFGFALNPKDEDLEPESYVLLDAAADKMRREQGLLEDDLIVPRGFIGRGMPLRVLQALAQQMYAHHTTQRRLEAAAPPYARASDL